VIRDNAERAAALAEKTMRRVKGAVGFPL